MSSLRTRCPRLWGPGIWIGTVVLATCLGCGPSRPTGIESTPSHPRRVATIPVRAEIVPLDPADPKRERLGAITVRSILQLEAADPTFGGFSGLVAGEGDRWLAVSDRGTWWAGRLVFSVDGALVAVDDVTTGPLPDVDGRPVRGRFRQDAEELVSWDRETILVAFEGRHRLQAFAREHGDGWRPATARASRELPMPPTIRRLPENSGLEAATRLLDGRLLALAEEPDSVASISDGSGEARHRAWIGDPLRGEYVAFAVAAEEGFRPTGAATLAGGDVVVLERFYRPEQGVRARLVRLAASDLASLDSRAVIPTEELARFVPPVPVDNFEAVAVDAGRILLVSDDNFSATQRTLFVHAELAPADRSADQAVDREVDREVDRGVDQAAMPPR